MDKILPKTLTENRESNLATKSILLIDDNPENLLGMEYMLEQEDCEFYKALTGVQGIDMAQKHDISIILLDVQMPEMNGFEVAEILQSNEATSHIPIIFITAMSRNIKYALRGFKEGAVDYLTKPVNPDFLRAKVQVFLRLEQQRREILQQYRQIEKLGLMVEHSVDMMAILDQKTLAFEEVNPAFTEILGYRPGQLKGQKITQLFCELKDVIHFEKQLTDYQKKQQKIMHFKIRVTTEDGEEKWLSINVAARMGKWFLNAHDITKEKSLKFKLMRSNKDLEQFAQMVAYELKDPINMVDQYLKLMEEGKSKKEQKRYAAYLSENLPKTSKLMDDLLYYAKINDSVTRQNISAEKLLQNALASLRQPIREAKAEINFDTLPEINCMPSQIEMLFRNLIKNALQFCEDDPKIDIRCEEKQDHWEFSIMDNGIGMNKKYAQAIFGNFEGAFILNKPKIRGIGLKICDRIVKRHGGKMHVDSKQGIGSTFYFTIKKNM